MSSILDRPSSVAAPGPGEVAVALAGVLIATALGALDQTIVTPALTAISTDLRSVDRLSWIVVAYLLASTVLMPVYGKLSDLYGRGRLTLAAIAVFGAASVFCAVAQTLPQLAAARALQGVGGGGLVVMAQAMIADFVSPRERGRYQVYIASIWAAAGIAGPPLGGLLADHAGWRWIFLINVPLAAVAFVLCRRVARRLVPPARARQPLDTAGIVLLASGVSSLLLALSPGLLPGLGAGSGPALCTAGLVLLAAFVAVEQRARDPLVPPRLYANRIIAVTNLLGFGVAILNFGALVLLPVFFQIVMGLSASLSGAMVIPMLLGIPIGSFSSGQVMSRTGRYKLLMPAALSLVTLAFAAFTTMTGASDRVFILAAVGVLGIGLGATFPVLIISTQNAAEARDLGAATSSVTFARALGASLGTAALWALLLAPLSTAARSTTQVLFESGRRGLAGLPASQQQAAIAALTDSFHTVFSVAAALALAAVALALAIKEEPLKTAPRTQLVKARSA